MAGEAAARADRLDMEAAEQLIQLSGGDGDGAAGSSTSESRCADSVKCCEANQAGVEKDEEEPAAVESRLKRRRFVTGKDDAYGVHAAGEPDRSSAGSVDNKCYRAAGTEAIKANKGSKEGPSAVESRRRRTVDGGAEERRRPRFRWLADVYRETTQLTTRDPRAAGGNGHPEAETKKKRKRMVGDTDKTSKERRMVA